MQFCNHQSNQFCNPSASHCCCPDYNQNAFVQRSCMLPRGTLLNYQRKRICERNNCVHPSNNQHRIINRNNGPVEIKDIQRIESSQRPDITMDNEISCALHSRNYSETNCGTCRQTSMNSTYNSCIPSVRSNKADRNQIRHQPPVKKLVKLPFKTEADKDYVEVINFPGDSHKKPNHSTCSDANYNPLNSGFLPDNNPAGFTNQNDSLTKANLQEEIAKCLPEVLQNVMGGHSTGKFQENSNAKNPFTLNNYNSQTFDNINRGDVGFSRFKFGNLGDNQHQSLIVKQAPIVEPNKIPTGPDSSSLLPPIFQYSNTTTPAPINKPSFKSPFFRAMMINQTSQTEETLEEIALDVLKKKDLKNYKEEFRNVIKEIFPYRQVIKRRSNSVSSDASTESSSKESDSTSKKCLLTAKTFKKNSSRRNPNEKDHLRSNLNLGTIRKHSRENSLKAIKGQKVTHSTRKAKAKVKAMVNSSTDDVSTSNTFNKPIISKKLMKIIEDTIKQYAQLQSLEKSKTSSKKEKKLKKYLRSRGSQCQEKPVCDEDTKALDSHMQVIIDSQTQTKESGLTCSDSKFPLHKLVYSNRYYENFMKKYSKITDLDGNKTCEMLHSYVRNNWFVPDRKKSQLEEFCERLNVNVGNNLYDENIEIELVDTNDNNSGKRDQQLLEQQTHDDEVQQSNDNNNSYKVLNDDDDDDDDAQDYFCLGLYQPNKNDEQIQYLFSNNCNQSNMEPCTVNQSKPINSNQSNMEPYTVNQSNTREKSNFNQLNKEHGPHESNQSKYDIKNYPYCRPESNLQYDSGGTPNKNWRKIFQAQDYASVNKNLDIRTNVTDVSRLISTEISEAKREFLGKTSQFLSSPGIVTHCENVKQVDQTILPNYMTIKHESNCLSKPDSAEVLQSIAKIKCELAKDFNTTENQNHGEIRSESRNNSKQSPGRRSSICHRCSKECKCKKESSKKVKNSKLKPASKSRKSKGKLKTTRQSRKQQYNQINPENFEKIDLSIGNSSDTENSRIYVSFNADSDNSCSSGVLDMKSESSDCDCSQKKALQNQMPPVRNYAATISCNDDHSDLIVDKGIDYFHARYNAAKMQQKENYEYLSSKLNYLPPKADTLLKWYHQIGTIYQPTIRYKCLLSRPTTPEYDPDLPPDTFERHFRDVRDILQQYHRRKPKEFLSKNINNEENFNAKYSYKVMANLSEVIDDEIAQKDTTSPEKEKTKEEVEVEEEEDDASNEIAYTKEIFAKVTAVPIEKSSPEKITQNDSALLKSIDQSKSNKNSNANKNALAPSVKQRSNVPVLEQFIKKIVKPSNKIKTKTNGSNSKPNYKVDKISPIRIREVKQESSKPTPSKDRRSEIIAQLYGK